MAKSKARYLADILQSDGSSTFVGDFSVPASFTIDPDGSPGGTVTIAGDIISTGPTGLDNASLQNDSITLNSYVTALGDSLTLDTDDISESSPSVNLWFTQARARESISLTDNGGDGSLTYNNGTGEFSFTGPSAAEVRAHFSSGTGVTLSSGQISIGQPVATTDAVTFSDITTTTTSDIFYDNSISGMTATNVQSAISELNNLVGGGNVGSQASFDSYEFTATSNQTTFDLANLGISPTPGYIVGYIQVFLNGVLLAEADYNATDGQTVVLGSGAETGDILTLAVLDSFDIANLLRVTSFDASAPQNNLVITSSGNVGIGTSNISSKLYVEGDQYVVTNSGVAASGIHIGTATSAAQGTYGGAISFDAGGLGASAIAVVNDSPSDVDSNGLAFFTHESGTGSADASERMRISATGNVGIGTTSPNQWASYIDSSATVLQVQDTSQRARIVINGGNGAHLDLVDYAGAANDKHLNFAVDGGIGKFGSLNDDGSAWIQQNILSMDLGSGNVGIGTDSPNSPLHIQADGIGLRFDGSANTQKAILFRSTGVNAPGEIYADGSLRFRTEDANTYIQFHTNSSGTNNERMRIDASGNVGIGVVPSASHYKSLEIGTSGSGITGRGAADTYFLSGLFWDGASTYEYSVSSVPVGTYQITNGIHSWATAPAGTAGTAATPQTNMTLDAAGNLLVGTTTTTAGNEGMVYFNGDSLRVTRDGNEPLNLDRLGSGGTENGSFVDFKSNGTTVGSIGTKDNNLVIGTGDTGVRFSSGTDSVFPIDTSTGNGRDAAVDLGLDSGGRFRDIYLSDNVIVGGGGVAETGEIQFVADSTRARIVGGYNAGGGGYLAFHTDTAQGTDLERARFNNEGNLAFTAGNGIDFNAVQSTASGTTPSSAILDDYEEGTWTPTINSGTTNFTEARYTKIGNTVTLRATAADISDATSATNINVGGLPFTPSSPQQSVGSVLYRYFSRANATQMNSFTSAGASAVIFYWSFDNGNNWDEVQFADGVQANMDMIFEITYLA